VTFETATQIGVDIIAPAVTIFTVWYAFRPWWNNHIGRAILLHSFGSMLLFDIAALSGHGIIPEEYPGFHAVTLTLVAVWILGWWYMVVALWMTRVTRTNGDGH
jgi:hypothetical protein